MVTESFKHRGHPSHPEPLLLKLPGIFLVLSTR